MGFPWLAVLTSVPWKEVISKAPAVADGARKLWNNVGKKPAEQAPVAAQAAAQPLSDTEIIATLQARMADRKSVV